MAQGKHVFMGFSFKIGFGFAQSKQPWLRERMWWVDGGAPVDLVGEVRVVEVVGLGLGLICGVLFFFFAVVCGCGGFDWWLAAVMVGGCGGCAMGGCGCGGCRGVAKNNYLGGAGL